jgi:homoserine O-acetyltransferase
MQRWMKKCVGLLFSALACCAMAQSYPAPKTGSWTAKDFRFHTGEVMAELKIGYTTVGEPTGEPVVILHGTAQSGTVMLAPAFAGQLFGPGQALDARKYFIILPDAIGTGNSSKPSNGLRAKFPQYNYTDMVAAQHRLVSEGLGLKHVRMVLGNSMGGMQAWMWGIAHPDFMDVLVPMASMPSAMSGRNWMMRRLLVDSIRNDPDWQGGNYTSQPRSMQFALVFFSIATSGGNQALQSLAPTSEKADQLLDQRLKTPFTADANDLLYQWASSRDYNPWAGLEKIKATLLAINSADDERNPPELGVMERALQRIPNARLLLLPGSEQTAGHGTTGQAKWWKDQVAELLANAPRKPR